MSPELPAALKAALERRLEGASRKALAQRAAAISEGYRAGRGSDAVVGGAEDALAYALARLPATYAACAAVLDEAARRAPGFAPQSLTDAGCGPGAAAWAAAQVWPGLSQARLLDSSAAFLELAGELAVGAPPALAEAARRRADLTGVADIPPADLVTLSYALAEIAPAAQPQLTARLWAATRGLLVVVEPGTPAGFARIRAARTALIAAGARILAPCPHEAPCPLAAPDWCHFVQRLPRSRDHRLAKGAEAPFEDEKFAYIVAARPEAAFARPTARVLAPPLQAKPGITLKLCTPAGLEARFVARRDRPAHARVRRLDWGDALD